jgi:quercetin dioxygenase-like cupin family protein
MRRVCGQPPWVGLAPGIPGASEGAPVHKFSIESIARQQLTAAHESAAARAATTVVGGHEQALRQTVLALAAGAVMHEHGNPGEATLYVLSGRITLAADGESWDARAGDMLVLPQARHTVSASQDSTLLLTAVPRSRAS